jgi:hypothetical protein
MTYHPTRSFSRMGSQNPVFRFSPSEGKACRRAGTSGFAVRPALLPLGNGRTPRASPLRTAFLSEPVPALACGMLKLQLVINSQGNLNGSPQTLKPMKTPNRLRTLSISLSLVILALGFSALGLISFLNKPSSVTSGFFAMENAYTFVGSSFSVLVGTIFLVAAISITFKGVKFGSERFVVAAIDATLV